MVKKEAEWLTKVWNSAFESMPDAVSIHDIDFRVLKVNKALADLLGKKPKDLVGKHCYEVFHKTSEPWLDCPHASAMEQKTTVTSEVVEPGLEKTLSVSASPIFDDDGEVLGSIHIARDITEKKRAEQALKESEERYQTLFNTVPHGIQISDREGIITFSNPAHHHMHGYKDGELIGKHIWDFVADESERENLRDYYGILIENRPAPEPAFVTDRTKEGQLIDVQVNWDYMYDDNGEVSGVCAIISDITERKEAETAIFAEKQKYQNLFNSSFDANYVIDMDGRYVEVNDSACKILGYTREELLGMTVFDVAPQLVSLTPKQREKALQDLRKRWREGTDVYEGKHLTKSGAIVDVEMTITPMKINDRELALGTVRDITDRKKAEDATRESYKFLQNIVDGVVEPIMVIDKEYRVRLMNQVAKDITGGDLGSLCYEISHHRKEPCSGKDHPCPLKIVLTQEEPMDVVHEHYAPGGGTRYIEIVASPWFNSDGTVEGVIETQHDITSRKESENEMMKRLLNFKLDDGNLYLVKENPTNLALAAFNDLLSVGYKGIIISRVPKEDFRTVINRDVQFYWLADLGRGALEPRLIEIERQVMELPRKSVVLIDRLDYLISKNGFKKTLRFFQHLREVAYIKGIIIILSIDPTTIEERELRLLENEGKDIEPMQKIKLSADLLDILKFIYKENIRGITPSFIDIEKEVGISQPTIRKRINILTTDNYVEEEKKGRNKVVELTEKGKRLFLT